MAGQFSRDQMPPNPRRMTRLKPVITKAIGLVAPNLMRCVHIFLARLAKLEALSATIRWFATHSVAG